MATLAPQPKLQFFDNNGDPLSGGKLYTYVAGTTTPQATYTDETGTVTNTNPVILDSRGEANVWFGPGTYKLKLATAADVEVWSVDDIGSQLSVADLATGIQTWLGNPTSANLRSAMVDETGTGALVFANAPTLVLPNVDVINEATPGVGVTVDGVVLKDSDVSAQDVTGSATVSAPVVNATGTNASAGVVRLYEDTDNGTNYVELKAPATLAANRSFVLPDADGTVQQFLKTDGSGNLAFASPLVVGTMQTGTGQTALEFTGLPSWVKKITIALRALSTSAGGLPLVQLGTGGAYVTTGYTLRGYVFTLTPAEGAWTSTTGFSLVNAGNGTYTYSGELNLYRMDAATNLWLFTEQVTDASANANAIWLSSGSIALAGAIDRLRLYIDGSQTFDAGDVNILYE